ncbi:MAG TPA: hypothetical protein VIX63_17050 [Vicinamibacterales bacterium]
MARRPTPAATDPFADLAKKSLILERELAVQQAALARLKALGEVPRGEVSTEEAHGSDATFNRL